MSLLSSLSSLFGKKQNIIFDPDNHIRSCEDGQKSSDKKATGKAFMKSVKAYQNRNNQLSSRNIFHKKTTLTALRDRKTTAKQEQPITTNLLEYSKSVMKTPQHKIQQAENELLKIINTNNLTESPEKLNNFIKTLAKQTSHKTDINTIKDFFDHEKQDIANILKKIKNNKTTKQQNNKTTKQQNNKTTKQQNNKTTKQQNNKTTKQQNNKTTKQQNNKTTKARLNSITNEIHKKIDLLQIKTEAFQILKTLHSKLDDCPFVLAYDVMDNQSSLKTCDGNSDTIQQMANKLTTLAAVTPKKTIGLKNEGNVCFINASIQAIRSGFRDTVFQSINKTMPNSVTKNEVTDAFISLKNALDDPGSINTDITIKQKDFIEKCKNHKKDGNQPFRRLLQTPSETTSKSTKNSAIRSHKIQQQDAQEFMLPLIEALGESRESTFSLQTRPVYTIKNMTNDKENSETNSRQINSSNNRDNNIQLSPQGSIDSGFFGDDTSLGEPDHSNKENDTAINLSNKHSNPSTETSLNVSVAKNINSIDNPSLILPLQFPQTTTPTTLQNMVDCYLDDEVLDGFKIDENHFDSTQYEINVNNKENEH